jgi:hypothetical protein
MDTLYDKLVQSGVQNMTATNNRTNNRINIYYGISIKSNDECTVNIYHISNYSVCHIVSQNDTEKRVTELIKTNILSILNKLEDLGCVVWGG